jgi:hypothetical protein
VGNAYELDNTKKKLEAMKQDFFDVCLENFEQNEAGAIAFLVNSMKEAIEANREIASIAHKIASLAEHKESAINKAENSQSSARDPTRG